MIFKKMYKNMDDLSGEFSNAWYVRISEISCLSTKIEADKFFRDENGRLIKDKDGNFKKDSKKIVYYVVKLKNGDKFYCYDEEFINQLTDGDKNEIID